MYVPVISVDHFLSQVLTDVVNAASGTFSVEFYATKLVLTSSHPLWRHGLKTFKERFYFKFFALCLFFIHLGFASGTLPGTLSHLRRLPVYI